MFFWSLYMQTEKYKKFKFYEIQCQKCIERLKETVTPDGLYTVDRTVPCEDIIPDLCLWRFYLRNIVILPVFVCGIVATWLNER